MFKKGAFVENKAAQQAPSEGMDKLSVFAAQGGEPSHVWSSNTRNIASERSWKLRKET